MTKEEMAERLNGREIDCEITSGEVLVASQYGLVVVYGASDDLTEFAGALRDAIGAYDGATHLLTATQIIGTHEDCECDYCGYDALVKDAVAIEAVWCAPDEPAWTFRTDIPHATFEIMEDGEVYCRGIVFSVHELRKAK